MNEGPSVKGTGVLPIVTALRAERTRLEPHLPEHLLHYVDDDVDLRSWYPVDEMLDVLRVMARVLMPDIAPARAFEYFGAVAAERDLLGDQRRVPESRRPPGAGVYEGAISKKHDLTTTVRRGCALWQLYFDEGEVMTKRVGERVLRFRREGHPVIAEELCHITRGYFLQVMRMTELEGTFERVSCRALGDATCDWQLTLPEGTDPAALAAFES